MALRFLKEKIVINPSLCNLFFSPLNSNAKPFWHKNELGSKIIVICLRKWHRFEVIIKKFFNHRLWQPAVFGWRIFRVWNKKNGSKRTFTFQNISASALLEKDEIVWVTSVKQFRLWFPECSWSWHVYMFLKKVIIHHSDARSMDYDFLMSDLWIKAFLSTACYPIIAPIHIL